MFSPALRHRQKVLAARAANTTASTAAPLPPPEQSAAGTEYAALLAVLHEHLRSLSDIQSHEQRQPKKAEYAREFEPWVAGIIAADQPVQDEILLTMMVWAVDCRDFDRALQLGAFVIRHGLAMPERYSRTPACFLAEEIADQALQQHEQVPPEVLLQVLELTADSDMPDPVQARLLKAIGRNWKRKADAFDPTADNAPAGGALAYVTEAIAHLERALKLDGEVGVKKDIQNAKALEKKLREAAQQQ